MRLICVLVAALVVFSGAVGSARQTPVQSQPTFRTGTILVPLDIHVLDESGKPVTGLTAKDFTIKEEGVAQRVAHFSSVNIVPQAPEPGTRIVRWTTPVDPAVPQARRVFLLMLGEGRLQGPSKGVDAIVQFVRTQLLPQDQVAVAAWNRATDFTTDRDQVLRVLGEFKLRNEQIQRKLDLFTTPVAAIYRVPEDYGDIQKDIDGVFYPRDGEGPAVRTLPSDSSGTSAKSNKAMSDQLALMLETEMRSGNAALAKDPLDMSFGEFAAVSHATMSDLGRLLAGVEYLRGVEGEKHLVFMSERGLFLPIPTNGKNDHDLVGMANDARVAIDTIQTGGVMTTTQQEFGMESAHREPTAAETEAVVVLSRMAELTGGLSSSYGYADQAFDRINQSTTSAYLLGYYPTKAALDGGYRHIEVTVNRPGLTVVFRHGYFATTEPKFTPAQALAYSRIVTGFKHFNDPLAVKAPNSNHAGELHDVLFTLAVSRTTGPSPVLHVDVAMSVAGLTFAPVDGQQNATLDVVVYCFDQRGAQIGDSWKSVSVNVPTEAFLHLPTDAVTKYALNLPAPTMWVEVAVYDYRSDRLGIVSVKIDPMK